MKKTTNELRREVLREKLRDHFTKEVKDRDYEDFEGVLDELDRVRRAIMYEKAFKARKVVSNA